MNRALKFLLIFVVVIAAVLTMTTLPFFSAFKTLFSNSEGMAEGSEYVEQTYSLKSLAEFIGQHPEFISVVSINLDTPDSSIYYQEDTPRSMGTLSNIILVAEYERQVEAEELNPNQPFNTKDLERLQLPDVSTNAYKEAISILKKSKKDVITLDDAVRVLVEIGDLTISDYLWHILGKENIENLLHSLELENTDLPLPFSGLYISISSDFSDSTKMSGYSDDDIIAIATKFYNDDDFNAEVKKSFKKQRLGITFMQERDALAQFPQTTANDMAKLMQKLYNNELISEQVSKNIRDKMRWVFGGETIPLTFEDYGAFYDTRMGMLSGIDLGVSKFTGSAYVQAMFFDKLPVAFWMHLSANHMQEEFQQRIIWDPALQEVTFKEISK